LIGDSNVHFPTLRFTLCALRFFLIGVSDVLSETALTKSTFLEQES
jgi:hypothetical protein